MTESQDRGQELLDRLVGFEWFSRVGSFSETANARPVKAWPEAAAMSCSVAWENVRLEFANDLRVKLRTKSIALYNTWNSVVRALGERLNDLVNVPVGAYVLQHRLPAGVVATVRWDVLHAAVEAHYSDIVPPGMYSMMFELYERGHFPCGWEGEWPHGVLLVS